MRDPPDIEALKAELADKKAMLADIESGKISLGSPFENRQIDIRRRIAQIESQIRMHDAHRA
jgi:hypothetical protein